MSLDVAALFAETEPQRYALHARYLNEQLVRVLKTVGFDVGFCRGEGQYLFDRQGTRYLDLMSGWGVFAFGRNHPAISEALKSVLDASLPNLVHMDASPLAGVLAERLIRLVPYLDKAHFCNSGTEAVEAALKFARCATGRAGIAYCSHAFHGLTYGALSVIGDESFRTGFAPFLPDCVEVPFNDLVALERVLASRRIAGFIVEPIQGKGVHVADAAFLHGAQELCRKFNTLFIADEIQTGIGRTGRFLAVEHWGVEPDMVLLSKALSGGCVPVGAVLTRKWIFDKVYNSLDRSMVHGSTFGKNDLAMAAGIATLDVIKSEHVIENAARTGNRLLNAFSELADRYELIKEVRGKGLMIGIEFGPPRSSLKLRATWTALQAMNSELFCQIMVIPLLKEHKILSQVAGHGIHTIKVQPSLTITDADCEWIERAFDQVIAAAHRGPSAALSLGKTLVDNAMRARATA
jgi:ornithine--oxo-acid transaminase